MSDDKHPKHPAVSVNGPLYARLKERADAHGITVAELTRRALEETGPIPLEPPPDADR